MSQQYTRQREKFIMAFIKRFFSANLTLQNLSPTAIAATFASLQVSLQSSIPDYTLTVTLIFKHCLTDLHTRYISMYLTGEDHKKGNEKKDSKNRDM